MLHRDMTLQARLMGSAAFVVMAAVSTAATAQEKVYNIAPQPLGPALVAFGAQSGRIVLADGDLTKAKVSPGLSGAARPEAALGRLLDGTGLTYRRSGTSFMIVQASSGAAAPQVAQVEGGSSDVEALIVTAQKREENIQDVPIAISAFSQEDLTTRQVAGGPDLITQIPNFSFTKTNFTGYSIQIRGIGTQAISATTDPAVAVAFNNTPFVRNHFFEQEFYDLERLEVLRGPQGTLYGRNATAGVVNVISAKPKFVYEAKASADIGNYNATRLEGMVNIPLVEDTVAMRLAGAWTKRDGYATNQLTGNQIDGRDLWSARASLRFEPNDWLSANLIYEHFEEDDDRLRSGKQLCKKDLRAEINGLPLPQPGDGSYGGGFFGITSYASQGCVATSLYSPEAFQTPNGLSLPYYGPLANLGGGTRTGFDPYLSTTQSRDLRVIESTVEPEYRAKSDLAELQISADVGEALTLSSETAYNADALWSLQDYNRFTTAPQAFHEISASTYRAGTISPDGVFCDPQLGCSDRLLLVDLSTSKSTQFSQEFRLSSDFEGDFNFSLGANFLRHDALDKYYVFINSLTLFSARTAGAGPDAAPWIPGVSDNHEIARFHSPGSVGDTAVLEDPTLTSYGPGGGYIDPNPIGSLNDQGRNYFLSKNPYKLISYAAFGEAYYNITPDLKLTGGLRFTVDKKQAPQIPSWLIVGLTAGIYPVVQTLDQEWREPTGRIAIDWKPVLSFTDDTLVYASYAHGYKAGGANPPPPVVVTYISVPTVELLPDTFEPEYLDAFEVGTKNTLLDGALTLNLAGFYYDYKGYQISEIRNRSAVNSNYDAEVWGLEAEADWRVTDAFRLGFKGGYQSTRVGDGMKAIDLMDRTAGREGWMTMRAAPWVPSNCIFPVWVVTAGGEFHINAPPSSDRLCTDAYLGHVDPITALPYVADPTVFLGNDGQLRPLAPAYADYPGFNPDDPELNGGRGFFKDLSGNELPNAPRYTATVTADYTMPLPNEWLMTLHGDFHYQSESWARIFNMEGYDKLKAFSTTNISAIFTNEDAGWKVMAYVKNVFDETALTGAFLNSDDSGLTTNVFLTEPRLYGVRVTKDWQGDGLAWLGGGGRHAPGGPYPVRIELGAGINQFGGDAEAYAPDWLASDMATFGGALTAQDDDLDWGDTRDVRLTYSANADWSVSAAYRVGKTNASHRAAVYEDVPGGFQGIGYLDLDNHAISAVRDTEEFAIVDFEIGKDLGLGLMPSTLSTGLRYAKLKSTSKVVIDGITESYVPPVIDLKYPEDHYNAFTNSSDSKREFEGVGPMVSWDASIRLAGNDEAGHVDLDWSIGGGVLFGKQTTENAEVRWGRYSYTPHIAYVPRSKIDLYPANPTASRGRTDDVTVPNLSLSLGLSYTVDRVKVSTGYSYDRFFDVVDGGVATAKSYDRTIQGPYLRLSLGFGG